MPYTTSKKSVKEVRYLNKDFTSFKDNLIEFSKIYFPNAYNDFNESSPGYWDGILCWRCFILLYR